MRFAVTLFGHVTSHGPLAILTEAFVRYISRVKYGMGSRKHLALNRWKRARKGLLQKERWDSCRES
jgi:hypothetical protein